MKEYIKNKVKILVETNKTKDIYKLCNIYDVNILYVDTEKKGVFLPDGNNNFILVNKDLSLQEEERVIIHEFSHFVLHREILM